MLDLIQIGKKLKALRKTLDLSQEQLAEKLYVTHQAISRWEQGKSLPSIETLMNLSQLYQTPLEQLLCFDVVYEDDIDQLFNNHSRQKIMHDLIHHLLPKYTVHDLIHKFTQEERYYLLNHLPLKITFTMFERLSLSERRFVINKVLAEDQSQINNLMRVCTNQEKNIIRRSK